MDYEEFREAGHQMIDYITSYLQEVQDKPLFPEVEPAFLYKLFKEPIPDRPQSLATILEVFDACAAFAASMSASISAGVRRFRSNFAATAFLTNVLNFFTNNKSLGENQAIVPA